MIKNILRRILRTIGKLTPNVRYVRAIPNLILKPIHTRLGLGGGVVDVMGFRMLLDPAECVDAQLWFAPEAYDSTELKFLTAHYKGGTFLDIGSNIGFWSLYFRHNFPAAQIHAIEANPETYKILKKNVELNNANNIRCHNFGVAGSQGVLPLYLNKTGNRGGDSLSSHEPDRPKTYIQVRKLSSYLHEAGISEIELIKMDIEGMEMEVLEDLFSNASPTHQPKLICAETTHSDAITSFLQKNGYSIVCKAKENTIFEKMI